MALTAIRRRLSAAIFPGSVGYWESRYQGGRTSGAGSYGDVARFKAEVLNDFVRANSVMDVIEFGCGDGHQLSLAEYPRYKGLDVSSTALRLCSERFRDDPTKSFYLYDPRHTIDNAGILRADLALSLDVIYHLVEDEIYESYLDQLFAAGTRYVIVFSSNHEDQSLAAHVRSRAFVETVEARFGTDWTLERKIENPHRGPESFADFYVFERSS